MMFEVVVEILAGWDSGWRFRGRGGGGNGGGCRDGDGVNGDNGQLQKMAGGGLVRGAGGWFPGWW